jgi:hypothetical protein
MMGGVMLLEGAAARQGLCSMASVLDYGGRQHASSAAVQGLIDV